MYGICLFIICFIYLSKVYVRSPPNNVDSWEMVLILLFMDFTLTIQWDFSNTAYITLCICHDNNTRQVFWSFRNATVLQALFN